MVDYDSINLLEDITADAYMDWPLDALLKRRDEMLEAAIECDCSGFLPGYPCEHWLNVKAAIWRKRGPPTTMPHCPDYCSDLDLTAVEYFQVHD